MKKRSHLTKQAKARQDNRGCTVTETKYHTHTYQKEDIDKTFVLDRSVEYSQILQEGNEQSVYGLTRLESEDTKYITGVNDTINLSIKDNEVTEYAYDDYGNSEDIEEGFGYNGEHKDRSGLIYLRARYYNPRIGRFLQIDSYKGEDNALATKNRYTYVANNPYKYDDPSGNAYKGITTNSPYANIGVKKAMSDNKKNVQLNFSFMDTFNNVAKAVANVIKNPPKVEIPKNSTVKTTPKNVNEMTPDEMMDEMRACTSDMLDDFQTILDWIGFIPTIGDAFDLINGIIYILRGKYVDGLISLASAALSVAADAILKPLRYAKNGIKEIFETIVKKLPDLPSAASKILKGLANTVDGLWLVGRKLKDSIIKGINAVVEFIVKHTREAYQSIRSKLIKEVTEAATEAATKGVGEEITEKVAKEATEDVIEDAVNDAAVKGASGAGKKLSAEELKKIGVPGKNSGIRHIKGTEIDARKLFDNQVIESTVKEVQSGVFVGKGTDGFTYTFRAKSKSGPPTIDVNGIPGLRKIKFLP